MKNLIKSVPIPICGLILAIFTLGNMLQTYSPSIKLVCAISGSLLLALVLARLIIFPRDIVQDLKNPVIASISGTFLMVLIVISSYIAPFDKTAGLMLYLAAITLFIALIVYFTLRFMLKIDLEKTYASYYIVYIGIAIAGIMAPVHGQETIGQAIFYFSALSFIVLLPLTSYRYLKLETPDPFKPLICINAAPFSLLLVAYLKSFANISFEFTAFMLAFAIVFYVFSLYKLIQYRNLSFYPSFAAFSFPFVVSSLCMIESNKYLIGLGIKSDILGALANIELIIAIVLVLYVLIRYLLFLNKCRGSSD